MFTIEVTHCATLSLSEGTAWDVALYVVIKFDIIAMTKRFPKSVLALIAA